MSVVVQQVDPHTEQVTAVAEFELRGDGVHATYHTPRARREFERDGIWTKDAGRLHPSDGQKFLDALPGYYARSSTMRVVDNHAGGPGKARTDYEPAVQATQPDKNTAPKPFVQGDSQQRGSAPGLANTAPGEVVPMKKRKKKPGAADPGPAPMHSDLATADDWDEAQHPREHGEFAPKGEGESGEAKPSVPKGPAHAGDEHRAAAKASAERAKVHAQGLKRVATKHPEHGHVAMQAEEHAAQAAQASRAAAGTRDPAQAEHHASQAHAHAIAAERLHTGVRKHAEAKLKEHEGKEHEKPAHGEGGGENKHFWQQFLQLLVGHPRR